MSYDLPNRITYVFESFDFGGVSNGTFVIRGPKGKKGRIWDVGVLATSEAFAGDSTDPMIRVGTATDDDAYVDDFNLAGAAINDAKTLRSTYDEAGDKAAFDAILVQPNLPANEKVVMTCVAGTGESQSGQGRPYIVIDWDR